MTERKVIQFRLTERDIENLDFVAELVNPRVSASDALRAGLELFCNRAGGEIRRAKPPSPELQKAIEEGKVVDMADTQLTGEDKEEFIRQKRAKGYTVINI